MNNDNSLVTNTSRARGNANEINKVQTLQDKTGATAKQIRKAIEQVGFDRDKVEQFLLRNKKQTD